MIVKRESQNIRHILSGSDLIPFCGFPADPSGFQINNGRIAHLDFFLGKRPVNRFAFSGRLKIQRVRKLSGHLYEMALSSAGSPKTFKHSGFQVDAEGVAVMTVPAAERAVFKKQLFSLFMRFGV